MRFSQDGICAGDNRIRRRIGTIHFLTSHNVDFTTLTSEVGVFPVSIDQMLYWYGNEFAETTGGWTRVIGGMSKAKNYFRAWIQGSYSQRATVGTNNLISVSNKKFGAITKVNGNMGSYNSSSGGYCQVEAGFYTDDNNGKTNVYSIYYLGSTEYKPMSFNANRIGMMLYSMCNSGASGVNINTEVYFYALWLK